MLAASPPFVQHVLQDRWQQQQQQQIGSSPQQLFEPHVVAASRAPVVADNKLRELASMASLAHHPSSPPPPPASHAQSPAAFAEPWIAGSDSPCAQSAAQSPPSGPPPRLSAGCGDSLPSPIPTPPCTCYSRLPAGCASDPHAPTVKYIGVRLRGRNRWVAEIKDNNHGVRKWLGTFACPVQAAQAFDAAARAIRGPKTKANFKRGDAAFVEDVPEVLSVLAYCAQGKPPLAAPGSAEGCARRAAGAALLAAVPVCRGESPMQSLPAGPQAGRRPGKPRTSPALGPLPLAIGPPTIAAPSLVGANPPAATPPAVRPPVPSPSSSSLVAASPMLPAASPLLPAASPRLEASPPAAFPPARTVEVAVKREGAVPPALLPVAAFAEAHAASERAVNLHSAHAGGRPAPGAGDGVSWGPREQRAAWSARSAERNGAQQAGGGDEGGAAGIECPSLWSPCRPADSHMDAGAKEHAQHTHADDMDFRSSGQVRLGKRRSPEPVERLQLGNCLAGDTEASMHGGKAGVLSLLSVGALQTIGERLGGRHGGETLKVKGMSLASLMPVAEPVLTPKEFGELRQRLGWKVVRMEDLEEIPRVAREALLRFRESKDSTMLSL